MSDTPMNEELASPPPTPPRSVELAGFWRRAAAFVVDMIVLMMIGSLLGMGLSSFFRAMGPAGRVVGFCVAGLYFAIFDGPLVGGRTLGKRLLGLRVVGADGAPLGWASAMVRAAPLGLLMALNGYPCEPDPRDPATVALSLLTLALLITIYLIAFERARRQGLHDIAASSFVVRASSPWVEPSPASRAHWAAAAALAIGVCALAAYLVSRLTESATFKPILAARAAVRAHVGPLLPVGVSINKVYIKGGIRTILQITVFYFDPPPDAEQIAVEIARTAIDSGYPTSELSAIGVSVVDGYTIGITSYHRGKTFVRTVPQWSVVPAHASEIKRTTLTEINGLVQAAVEGRIDELEKLLKAGSDPNFRDSSGDTPLMSAAAKGRADSADVLLNYGADANARNINEYSPLMYAASAGNAELVSRLLKSHADPNARDSIRGMTSLHDAIDAGRDEVVRLLLAGRADLNAVDKEGHSALWHARNAGRPELTALLIKAGAHE